MCLSEMSNCDLIALSSSIAISIGKTLNANELSILSAFITALGDNLAIIATQKSIEDSKKDTSDTIKSDCLNF